MSDIAKQIQKIREAVVAIETEISDMTTSHVRSKDDMLQAAFLAVRLYAETHPRPSQVTQVQAAEMLGVSAPTVSRLIRAGTMRLNRTGQIPVTEVDRCLAPR